MIPKVTDSQNEYTQNLGHLNDATENVVTN